MRTLVPDFTRRFDTINTPNIRLKSFEGLRGLLDQDPLKPGFERNHHELLAMAALAHFW